MRRLLPTLCEGGFVERADNVLAFGLPGRGKTHLLVSIVLIALGWSVYEKPGSQKRWIALIASATVGIWLSYPSAFVIGAIGLLLTHLVVSQRKTRLVGMWLVFGLCVTLSFTAMYLMHAKPHAAAAWPADDASTIAEWGRGFPPLATPWRLPAWLWDVHSGNMLAYPYGGRQSASIGTASSCASVMSPERTPSSRSCAP